MERRRPRVGRGSKYSDRERSRAFSLIASGHAISRVSHLTGIPESTLNVWKTQYGLSGDRLLTERHVESLGDKILEYMSEQIDTLIAHQKMARDPDWFSKQTATEIAALNTTTHKNLVGLLAAQQLAQEKKLEMERQKRLLDGDAVEGSYTEDA
jgi:hypothetical protein